jgi:ketosteroid isomerase-like protein
MSLENVEVVRRGWEHFLATGEPLDEISAPDFVWDMSTFRGWPEQPYYEGTDEVRRFFREWMEPFDDWRIDVQALHDAGEKVVSVCRQTARARTSGMPIEMNFAMVFTLRNGLQTRMQMYADPDEALKAVGLQE